MLDYENSNPLTCNHSIIYTAFISTSLLIIINFYDEIIFLNTIELNIFN